MPVDQLLQKSRWTLNSFGYKRRATRVVMVGHIGVGGENPIRVQSMTTTPTMETNATVAQVLRLAEAGCEIARITAPTILEARNLENIKKTLIKAGCNIPLVADIHFRPDAAMAAADFVEKVRINPGNFTDGKAFKVREYTEDEYQDELKRIEEKFTPLVLKLKRLKGALRIGTNHGSLSDRIMNRFGDTPLGMVESALEFVRLCRKNDYHDIILSMKASNPHVMVSAYRLLADRMAEEGMDYPFHLGVTEAGNGEDGRIKSAAGIGSLLEDGIGDTIRVSLTEDPEQEIPVAQELAKRYSFPSKPQTPNSKDLNNSIFNGGVRASDFLRQSLSLQKGHLSTHPPSSPYVSDPFSFNRRESENLQTGPFDLGSSSPIRVLSHLELNEKAPEQIMSILEDQLKKDTPPEILNIPYTGPSFSNDYQAFCSALAFQTSRLAFWISFQSGNIPSKITTHANGYVYQCENLIESELASVVEACRTYSAPLILKSSSVPILLQLLSRLKQARLNLMIGLQGKEALSTVYATRALVAQLKERGERTPIVLGWEEFSPSLETSIVLGSLICDGIGDVVSVCSGPLSKENLGFAYNLLQACGNRLTKTEYVSCPSCGRTLFDLQTTTERIKSKTGHLKGVKIAIMGCIVNGPGEMADADFGYVGGGPGKINLYVGKTCVEKSIPTDMADEKLMALIKSHGKWVDPPQAIPHPGNFSSQNSCS